MNERGKTMKTVTRKITHKPSNSKSPGGTHHVTISGQKFATTAELRGTGWGVCEIDADEATLQVAATFMVGKRGKSQRIVNEVNVIVTGNASDVVELAAEYTDYQALRVEFRGVKTKG
jgi:hypothetical protein